MYGPSGAYGASGPYGAPTGVGLPRAVRRKLGKAAVRRRLTSVVDTVSTIASRAEAKQSELEEYARVARTNAIALRGAANTMRTQMAPEIKAYMTEFRGYIAFIDSIVYKWYGAGVFGDYRDMDYHRALRASSVGGTSTSSILRNIGDLKSAFGTLDTFGLWPDLRGEVNDVFRELIPVSTSLWAAYSALMGLFNDTVALYDKAGDIVTAANRWDSMGAAAASDEICRNYLNHSNYRRLRRDRNPGKHAAWDEVCDRYENPDNGEHVYWSRDGDPMGFGPMPSRLKRGKSLVEEGCLPGEACGNYNLTGPEVPGLNTANALMDSIKTAYYGYSIDNVLTAARGFLQEVKDVVNEVIGHLKGIRDGWGWSLVPRLAASYAKSALNGVISNMRDIRDGIQEQRVELNNYKTYWRSGSWRSSVTPAIALAEINVNNLDDLRSRGIRTTCNIIYPNQSRSSAVLGRYWKAQGVKRSCRETRGKPYISWEAEPRLRLDWRVGKREAGDLISGESKALEALTDDFGSIVPARRQAWWKSPVLGFPLWQVALVGGAGFWYYKQRKK